MTVPMENSFKTLNILKANEENGIQTLLKGSGKIDIDNEEDQVSKLEIKILKNKIKMSFGFFIK